MTAELFATGRLTAVPAADCDLDALLEVYTSNPGTLAVTEGSAGEPGHYDRGMLERDLWMAELEPGRTAAALLLAGSDRPVGAMDWLDAHPEREIPWLGMLMVHATYQRRGLGRDAMAGLAGHGRGQGWERLGAGCLTGDARAEGFLAACGFAPTGRVDHRFAAGERSVSLWLLELQAVGGGAEGVQVGG